MRYTLIADYFNYFDSKLIKTLGLKNIFRKTNPILFSELLPHLGERQYGQLTVESPAGD